MEALETKAKEIRDEVQVRKNTALRVGNFLVSLLSYIKNNLQLKIFSGTHIAQAQIDTTGTTPKASASFDETTKKFSFQFWLPKGEKGDTVVGPAGMSAYRLDLDNENASIPCTHEGIPLAGIVYPNCNAKLFYGDELKPCTFTYTPDGITCNGTTAMSSNTSGILSLSAITKDIATVVVGNSIKPSVSAIMTISKIYGGINGEDAVIYWLSPSVSVIKKNTEGVLFPSELNCSQLKQVGNKAVEYSRDTILKYRQLPDGEMQTYTDKVLVSNTSTGIEFSMYSPDASIVLDSETIPVLSDGKTPVISNGEWVVNGSTTGIVAEGASTYALKSNIPQIKHNPNTGYLSNNITFWLEKTTSKGEVSVVDLDKFSVIVSMNGTSYADMGFTKNTTSKKMVSENLKDYFTRKGNSSGLNKDGDFIHLSCDKGELTLYQMEDGTVGKPGGIFRPIVTDSVSGVSQKWEFLDINDPENLPPETIILPKLTVSSDNKLMLGDAVISGSLNGATGAQGLQGQAGVKGADGITPTVSLNTEGKLIINGTVQPISLIGPKGDVGVKGTAGVQGIQGPIGPSPTVSLNTEGKLVVNGSVQSTSLIGPQGIRGIQGVAGDTKLNPMEKTFTTGMCYAVSNDGCDYLIVNCVFMNGTSMCVTNDIKTLDKVFYILFKRTDSSSTPMVVTMPEGAGIIAPARNFSFLYNEMVETSFLKSSITGKTYVTWSPKLKLVP